MCWGTGNKRYQLITKKTYKLEFEIGKEMVTQKYLFLCFRNLQLQSHRSGRTENDNNVDFFKYIFGVNREI